MNKRKARRVRNEGARQAGAKLARWCLACRQDSGNGGKFIRAVKWSVPLFGWVLIFLMLAIIYSLKFIGELANLAPDTVITS